MWPFTSLTIASTNCFLSGCLIAWAKYMTSPHIYAKKATEWRILSWMDRCSVCSWSATDSPKSPSSVASFATNCWYWSLPWVRRAMGSSFPVLSWMGWGGAWSCLSCSKWLLVGLKMSASSWGSSTPEMLENLAAVLFYGSHEVDVLFWVSFDRLLQVVETVNLVFWNITLSKK